MHVAIKRASYTVSEGSTTEEGPKRSLTVQHL